MKQPCKFLSLSAGLFLTAFLNMGPALARGGETGGGGDSSEIRVNDIRIDILKWIDEGGPQQLTLPHGMTKKFYYSSMRRILSPHAVVLGFVTTEQENNTLEQELKVSVNGQPKTCRGFVSIYDQLPHILCNIERFTATAPGAQYRLIHHEYAGLAGVEQNIGASSDYVISDKITDFLDPEVVLRLSVKQRRSNGANVRGASSDVESVIKITDSIDRAFLEKCIQNLKPDQQGLLSCIAVNIPRDKRILTDDGLLAALNYVVTWSESSCALDRLGRLYSHIDSDGNILLFTESKACLEKMANVVDHLQGANGDGGRHFKNRSLFLTNK